MFTNLSAVQINRLAQRLSEAPLGRSASVAAAAERFERLLAAKIGAERAHKAINSILTAPGFETAEGRLVAEIDACEPDAPAEPAPPLETPEPIIEPAPVIETEPAAAMIVEATETQSEPVAAPSAPRRRRDATSKPKPGGANCPRRPTSPPRPMPVSGPSWPRWWKWRGRPMPPACAPSRSTRSHPAPKRWPAIATLRCWRSNPGRAGHEDHPQL